MDIFQRLNSLLFQRTRARTHTHRRLCVHTDTTSVMNWNEFIFPWHLQLQLCALCSVSLDPQDVEGRNDIPSPYSCNHSLVLKGGAWHGDL